MDNLTRFIRIMSKQRKEFWLGLGLLVAVNATVAWLNYGSVAWVLSTILASTLLLALVMYLIVIYG